MQYGLTDDQETLRKSMRDLAQAVIAPKAEEIDDKAEFPLEVWQQLSKYGWLGLVIPEVYGGAGASVLTACAVIEEVAKCRASSSLILAAHFQAATPIIIAASEDQKHRYLPVLAVGDLAALANFPAIQLKLAEMATQTEAARQLVYKAAAMVDAGSSDVRELSPMAKAFASDTAVQVTGHAMQIMGAYGYMKEYPIERMLRDAKVVQVYEGGTESQKMATAQEVLA